MTSGDHSIAPPGKGKSVLISGGSIAGPTLAFWLNKHGFETTIVERWHELRPGGQNVDVRGVGRQIITDMGLFDAIKARNTTEEGFRLVSSTGKAIASFPALANGFTAELEILRGDFAEVLYDATKEKTRYLFGDCIVAIDDEENGKANQAGKASVTFLSGRKEDFDIVVIADGVRSRTRKLVFGDEVSFKQLNLSIAYATIPRSPTDEAWCRWYTPTGRRGVGLRPDPYGTTRAGLTFMSEEGYTHLDKQGQLDLLRRKFSGAGWETERILQAIETSPDLYCEDIMQVKAPRYSCGRVVMIGDAAYCGTPISGKGTLLALTGAYILAGELAKHPEDYKLAFKGYEANMRPIASKAQKLPLGAPGILHPESRLGVWALEVAFRVTGWAMAVVMAVPWPRFLRDWTERQGFGEDGTVVPEYRELRQYW